jgi:hypothetical protein
VSCSSISELKISSEFENVGEHLARFPALWSKIRRLWVFPRGLENIAQYPALTASICNLRVRGPESGTKIDIFAPLARFANLENFSVAGGQTGHFASAIRAFPKSLTQIEFSGPKPTIGSDPVLLEQLRGGLRESEEWLTVEFAIKYDTRLEDKLGQEGDIGRGRGRGSNLGSSQTSCSSPAPRSFRLPDWEDGAQRQVLMRRGGRDREKVEM